MSCQSAVYQWTEVVTTHMPHLSKPGSQAQTQENVRLDSGRLPLHDLFLCENGYFYL